MIHLKFALFAPLAMLAISPASQGQNFTHSQSVIAVNPYAGGYGDNFEDSLGFFDNSGSPSYFLGSFAGARLFTPSGPFVVTSQAAGEFYESSKTYLYPGNKYPDLIVSENNQLVMLINPANGNGGNASVSWGKFVINQAAGCHILYVVDLDGDGQDDVACSGSVTLHTTSFVVFQNSRFSWSPPVNVAPSGDGIAPIAINGVNGGAENSLVGCNPNGNGTTLYFYKNPGGAAARNAGNWGGYPIGHCNQGATIGSLNVGNREIAIVGASETPFADGLAYFDPGSNPYGNWAETIIDSSYVAIHQVNGINFMNIPLAILGEQEQSSSICNNQGYNLHPQISGCRVAIFPWTGSGFGSPTLLSNLGTHNQESMIVGNTLYIAGTNHDLYGATDPNYDLWEVQLAGTGSPLAPGTYEISSGKEIVDGGFGYHNATPYVQFYSENDNAFQHWTWDGSRFLNVGWAGHYMADAGNGTVTENASGDTWTVTASGGGYVVHDSRTGHYLENNGNILAMGSTATVWAFASSTGIPGGSLTGSVTTSNAAVNLTTEGTTDWIHWGNTAVNRKSGVTARLSSYTVIGTAPLLHYTGDFRPVSWTDGTPTASTTNDTSGVYVYTVGDGFSLTAPADTTTRKLILHLGGWDSGAKLTAHLSDGSAVDYTNTAAGSTGQYDDNYTLIYNAASPGQALTVTWTMASGVNGNVTLSAAALQ